MFYRIASSIAQNIHLSHNKEWCEYSGFFTDKSTFPVTLRTFGNIGFANDDDEKR